VGGGGGGVEITLQRGSVCQRCYLAYLRKDQQRLMSRLVDDDEPEFPDSFDGDQRVVYV